MPDNADVFALYVEGRGHKDWLSYRVETDWFTPAAAWRVRLGLPSTVFPAWLRPWSQAQARVGDDVLLTGRVDTVRRVVSRRDWLLELTGRDNAAVLLDCSAPLFVRREVTLTEVCDLAARPLGVDRIEVRGGGRFRKIAVEPGMTAWEAVREAARAQGLRPRFRPDGTLLVAAPDSDEPVTAELCVEQSPASGEAGTARTNVMALDVEEDASGRYGEVTVLGQSTGAEDTRADNAVRAVARDEAFAGVRPLIRREAMLDGEADALDRARRLVGDGILSGMSVTATVQGHRNARKALWEPGQRVHVHAPPLGVDADMLLARCVFTGDGAGHLTRLTLRPWGCWTAGK